MDDLENVLKALKSNKARDAHGHTYEIYKYEGKRSKILNVNIVQLGERKTSLS